MPKGENIHTTDATEALSSFNAAALIVLDQGSRGGPPILPGVPTLILDHHLSTVFPEEAQASHSCMPRICTCSRMFGCIKPSPHASAEVAQQVIEYPTSKLACFAVQQNAVPSCPKSFMRAALAHAKLVMSCDSHHFCLSFLSHDPHRQQFCTHQAVTLGQQTAQSACSYPTNTHHQSLVPQEAEHEFFFLFQVASAYGHEPVATTSLLAYVLCHELHPSLEDRVAWLGVLGTFGDLGSSVKWQDPFPDMTPAIKQHGGKTKFSQAVSLINARKPINLDACLHFKSS